LELFPFFENAKQVKQKKMMTEIYGP